MYMVVIRFSLDMYKTISWDVYMIVTPISSFLVLITQPIKHATHFTHHLTLYSFSRRVRKRMQN